MYQKIDIVLQEVSETREIKLQYFHLLITRNITEHITKLLINNYFLLIPFH